jgi:hypothetical protein
MSWEVNDKELDAVLALPAPKRYEYFVKHVADSEELWGLRDSGGFVVAADDGGGQSMPVWPHRRYAEACAQSEWSGSEPEPISLSEWLEGWSGELEEDGRKVAVFPDQDSGSVVREPGELREDLRAEAAQYE